MTKRVAPDWSGDTLGQLGTRWPGGRLVNRARRLVVRGVDQHAAIDAILTEELEQRGQVIGSPCRLARRNGNKLEPKELAGLGGCWLFLELGRLAAIL